MALYRTTFPVKASAERAWQVLTDFASYSEWNPQVPLIEGEPVAGNTVKLKLVLPKRPSMNLSAKLTQVTPPREFWWKGHVLAPWFFQGERQFSITDGPDGSVMVTHGEHLTGVFSPVFKLLRGGPVSRSHHALNEALRLRCEQAG